MNLIKVNFDKIYFNHFISLVSFSWVFRWYFYCFSFVLYMIKTRFTQNTCISWFLMLDLDLFRFHQAQGTCRSLQAYVS